MNPLDRILERLSERGCVPKKQGRSWTAKCPAHDDSNPSLSVREGKNGSAVLHCHAGCAPEDVLAAIGLTLADLFSNRSEEEGWSHPRRKRANAQASGKPGLTLEMYACSKELPIEFLKSIGLDDANYYNPRAVMIPYLNTQGQRVSTRFRISMCGENRFRWKTGSKAILYGLERLRGLRDKGSPLIICEGESDCHTLWFHGVAALGIPGANTWRQDWCAEFEGFAKLCLIVEPDNGGATLLKALSESALADRLWIVRLDGAKDASELHMQDPQRFAERFQLAIEEAVELKAILVTDAETKAADAFERCADLARSPNILEVFGAELAASGVAGECQTGKLLFLALVSRLLDRPVSVVIKGPSSAGKSFIVEKVLAFFPASAYYALSAMSERSLAYSEEPLKHRVMVLYELAGLSGEMSTYLMRSLLSEGCVRYETVEKTRNGLKPKLIEREGPTGLIVTTTLTHLHPENETRMLSITVSDSPAQTRLVLQEVAREKRLKLNVDQWIDLQTWLVYGDKVVTIPYSETLANLVADIAVRLRRDFGKLLSLIRAHALLHRATRDRNAEGAIVATIGDYEAIRELVVDLLAEGVEASVPDRIRETVEAVSRRGLNTDDGVSNQELADELGIDKSSASRRAKDTLKHGYIRNLEEKRGRQAKYVIGDPLPDEVDVLPTVDQLSEASGNCAVALERQDNNTPPPPDSEMLTGQYLVEAAKEVFSDATVLTGCRQLLS